MINTIGRLTVYIVVYAVAFIIAKALYEEVLEFEYSSNAYLFGLFMGMTFAPLWKWVKK